MIPADAAENADAEPLNAVIAAVPVLPEGSLEGALLASGTSTVCPS